MDPATFDPWTADTEYCCCLCHTDNGIPLPQLRCARVCVYKKTACFTLVPPSPSLSVGSQATSSWQHRESLSGSVHFILSTHSDPLMDQTILKCQRCYGMTHCPVPPTQLSNPHRDTQSHGMKVQNREVVKDRALSFEGELSKTDGSEGFWLGRCPAYFIAIPWYL